MRTAKVILTHGSVIMTCLSLCSDENTTTCILSENGIVSFNFWPFGLSFLRDTVVRLSLCIIFFIFRSAFRKYPSTEFQTFTTYGRGIIIIIFCLLLPWVIRWNVMIFFWGGGSNFYKAQCLFFKTDRLNRERRKVSNLK